MWLTSQVSTGSATPRRGAVITPRPTKISGAAIPAKYSSLKGRGFSCFEYQEEFANHFSPRPQQKLTAMSPRSGLNSDGSSATRPVFKHSALPPAPGPAGSFQRFRYSCDPYELLEDHKRVEFHETRAKPIAGAFSAGGNARDTRRMLKRRAPELKASLLKTLKADWPSFLRVFFDERGILVACFDAERLNSDRRADLHEYMNRLLNTHAAAAEFGLSRDSSRWGGVHTTPLAPDLEEAPLVYALRPPWVPNDLVTAQRLLEQSKEEKKPAAKPAALPEEGAPAAS